MKELENRLQQILKLEEDTELPLGHEERFLRKLDEAEKRSFWVSLKQRIFCKSAARKIAWAAVPAVLVAGIIIFRSSLGYGDTVSRMEKSYRSEMLELGNKLSEDSRNLSEGTKEEALYSITSIVSEDEELMALQLPENLSKKEKLKIIKEYYNQKMDGLKKIQTFIAMNSEETE